MRLNAEALKGQRPELARKHPDRIALMHGGKVQGIFQSLREAEAEGVKRFPNRMFSLHELTSRPRRVGSVA